jgi:hypothetical protein
MAKDAVQETREVCGTVRHEDVEVVDGTVTGGTARTTASETYVEDIVPATGLPRRS